MNFRNIFKRAACKRAESAPSSSDFEPTAAFSDESSPSSEPTGWESVAALRSDSEGETTFDDLSAVEFAGYASVPDSSGTLNPDLTATEIPPAENLVDAPAASPEKVEIPADAPAASPEKVEIPADEIAEVFEHHESESSPELQAFKNFFKTDLRVKRELMRAAPRPADDYDEDSRMEYVEHAYRTFRDFRSDFRGIERDFEFGDAVSAATDQFFERGAEKFSPRRYDSGIASEIYRSEFTDMRPAFVEEVKDACVGYKVFKDFAPLISDSRTVNELLHAYHGYITNNESILQKIPALAEKKNDYDYPVVLRGEETAMSRQVFDAIPSDLDVGWTDIIGVDEHVLMMVRDRGHALTIDASPDAAHPDKMWVEYNIPKLCNVEMIKALPGLAGYTENGARGGFFTGRDDLGAQISSFIARVPTDMDMPGIHE